MTITITLNTDNAAFDLDNEATAQEGSMFETARILHTVADRFARPGTGRWLGRCMTRTATRSVEVEVA